MKKVKTVLSLALSALILMPLVTPSGVCTNTYHGVTGSTRRLGSKGMTPSGRSLAARKKWIPAYLSSKPAHAFECIDSLSPDMTPAEWNEKMKEILDIVWDLNARRQKYAAWRNKKMATAIHSAVWDMLLYLFDHITFDCQVGSIASKIGYDKISIILYIAGGGDIDDIADISDDDEPKMVQGVVTNYNIVRWAKRPPNEDNRKFALEGLEALWYDTAPHRTEFDDSKLARGVLKTLETKLADLGIYTSDKLMSSLVLVGDTYKYSGDQIDDSLPSRKHPGKDIYEAYCSINTAPLLEISEDSSDDFSDDSSYYV